jgi:pyruvate,orthophosphate dikinase
MKATPRFVYGLDELNAVKRHAPQWDDVRSLLGGKGANLAEMTRIGMPVPPGFVVTTEACREYLKHDKLPARFWTEVEKNLRALEKRTGKRFGDAKKPLLVSCRSGAKFSMPGMMDTVLNLGLTEEVIHGLAHHTGDARFAWDSARRLVQMFGSVVMGVPDELFEVVLKEARAQQGVNNDADLTASQLETIHGQFKERILQHAGRPFPESPQEQLTLAIEAVFRSWKGKRAIDYRKAAGIADGLGTAVNIVTMVFGNMGPTSATGVATTRNVSTGEKSMEGDFLVNAQGEDVVSGTRETRPIGELAAEFLKVVV